MPGQSSSGLCGYLPLLLVIVQLFSDRFLVIYRLPWSADGVPCLVRCGKYGVVARLSAAELSAAVASGAPTPGIASFFGQSSEGDATGDVLAGPGCTFTSKCCRFALVVSG